MFHNNIWTKTNVNKDLCRYLYCRFTFYRHDNTDFIVAYERQPPWQLSKYTYPSCHPHQMLQQRHKKIILSKQTKPTGKLTKKLLIKPPKQMITKWFFTSEFAAFPLLLLKATACNFRNSYLGANAENQHVTIIYLNPTFYQLGNWGNASITYQPYATVPSQITFTYMQNNTEQTFTYQKPTQEDKAISLAQGWFQPKILQAIKTSPTQAALPTSAARYNPNLDDGTHSRIWLSSSLTADHSKPTKDSVLLLEGLPLWLGLLGWLDYVKEKKPDPGFLKSYYIVLESDGILPPASAGTYHYFIPIDYSFWLGKSSQNQYTTVESKNRWIPLLEHQMETINAIVESGPYMPKYSPGKDSTWELKCGYSFCFKWGGPLLTEPNIEDPSKQPRWDVPDKLFSAVQIQNPEKQKTETLLHPWDFRRGFIKQSAIKRMCENFSTDSDFQESQEGIPRKRQRLGPALQDPEKSQEKIKTCLQELFKESSYQETQEEPTIQQLIQQQREYQQQLKRNLLQILSDMKQKQNTLQLQTGMFN